MPRILRIDDFYLEAIPEGHMLLINNEDKPGVIGRICSVLGSHAINISRMHVGQDQVRGRNAVLLGTSTRVNRDVLEEIRAIEDVQALQRIDL
jgi:D-3-phosphoglycerate dehydrogenase